MRKAAAKKDCDSQFSGGNKMKKVLCTVLVIVLTVLMLAGCGKTQATKSAEELIASIGDLKTGSKEAVSAAREAYDSLSDEEKAKVKNADKLESAETELKSIDDINGDISSIIDAAGTSFSSEDFDVSGLIKKAEEIEAAYGDMPEAKKEMISGFDKISEAKAKLESYSENAVRAAAQYVKAFNKTYEGKNYTVTAVYCIKQIRNETDEYHLLALTYKDSAGKETDVYAHARCTTEVTADAIAARPETFFADAPATDGTDAKLNGNVELDISAVLAAAD